MQKVQYTATSTHTARQTQIQVLSQNHGLHPWTGFCTGRSTHAEQPFSTGIYSLMIMQCKGKLLSAAGSIHPLPPKGGCKRTGKASVATLGCECLPTSQLRAIATSSSSWRKNQESHRKDIRATTEATRYSSSREDGSNSTAFHTSSPRVTENTAWVRGDGAWRVLRWPRNHRKPSTAVSQHL